MNKNIRGYNPLHKVMLTAAATMVFAGIFIFGFLISTSLAQAVSTEDLIDEVPSGSLSQWEVNDLEYNPVFTYKEVISPYDGSTAIENSVVGNTIMMCETKYLKRTHQWGGNTTYTDLEAYLAFTSSMSYYNFPYVVIQLFDENDVQVGSQVYYGKGITNTYYDGIISASPNDYTELPVTEGDVVLDLSVMGSDINFKYFTIMLANYTCEGENSLTFDHLRILNGTPSVILPTGSVDVSLYFGEAIGTGIPTWVSISSSDSPIDKVCLWLGDDTKNLFDPAPCKTLAEKDSNSHDQTPSFYFSWDSTLIDDGTYSLHAFAVDTAGNEAKLTYINPVIINNYSLGSAIQPAPITTCSEFQAINQHSGWHYEILNDIDCSDTKNWNSGRGFLPLNEFGGVIDGQDFNVSKLFIRSTDSGGIFSDNSGKILNLNLRDADVYSGGYGGGLTRYNRGTIHQSSFTGKVGCGNQQCGGLAGVNQGKISESWVDIDIDGPNYVGALVGHATNGQIENCYAKGKMNSASQSGGLVGLNESTVVVHSYSTNEVNQNLSNGGLIGWMYQYSSQNGSYWNKELSGKENMCGSYAWNIPENCDDSNGLTDVEMKDSSNFVDWNFEDIWSIDPLKNEGYPYLRWQTSFTEGDVINPEPEPEVIDEPTSGGSGGTATRIGDRKLSQAQDRQGLVLGAQTSAQLEQMRQIRLQLIKILTLYVELLKKNLI